MKSIVTSTNDTIPEIGNIFSETPYFVRRSFLETDECLSIVKRLYSLKDMWQSDYDGQQYSFPDNFYARVNSDIPSSYHERHLVSENLMDEHFSSERAKLNSFLSQLAPDMKLSTPEKWNGPGFAIFPSGKELSFDSCPIHIDLEGLEHHAVSLENSVCFSVICMIQAPKAGGGLRIWRSPFAGDISQAQNFFKKGFVESGDTVEIEYQTGDLVIINSLCPHQILKMQGGMDRITMNAFGYANSKNFKFWF